MNKDDLMKQLCRIDCQLSPENLTCDGELPVAEVRRRERILTAERAKVIKQLGYEPTSKEIFGY